MNLADYLRELLDQQEEVSVPGLGYFVRTRVSAYYNEKEAKFYPPYHQAKFVPQIKDDDTFAQYIADKKNISLASSKYFTEKFIAKLKEDAATGKYLFSDLGWFQTERDQLVFKPNEKINADPAFYGYSPVNINKLGLPQFGGHTRPVFSETVSAPVAVVPPVQTIERQQYFEEDTERKRPLNIWLLILIVIAVIALGVFGAYQFYPPATKKMNAFYYSIAGKKNTAAARKDTIKVDTGKKAIAVSDTSAAKLAPLPASIDTANVLHFEIITDKFKKWQKAKAEAQVLHYRALGLAAEISKDAPGILLKVSVGTYFTRSKADSVMIELISSVKITSNSRIEEIKPKQ